MHQLHHATTSRFTPIGTWTAGDEAALFAPRELLDRIERIREPVAVVLDPASSRVGLGFGGRCGGKNDLPLLASLPSVYPEWLGDRSFAEVHGTRFPYVAGAMARGIASTLLVRTMAEAGFIGFFGAAGLSLSEVEGALKELNEALADRRPWGCNLIHSPDEPELEEALVELYLCSGVRRVSAAAFMKLSPAVVRYACTGLHVDERGQIQRQNFLFAKISRPEVAQHFLQPPPEDLLKTLVERGQLSDQEARLARRLPLAEDLTVEADSAGHTDRQSLSALFPTLQRLRDEISATQNYPRPIRLGAAGGLGTPAAVAAAFALGADYVLTGSVNQACVESGLHVEGRRLLAQAQTGDQCMAPAADMFELGVEVQVLKRGTLFASRARKLFELYARHPSLDAIPGGERQRLEREIFAQPLDEAWQQTRDYWQRRDPQQLARAEREPQHKMALLFRGYLGRASRWAIAGEAERRLDYQIWSGPAMGSFNAWTAGSFLADPENRSVAQVARNLMEGAAVVTRAQQLRSAGVALPAAAFDFRPRNLT